MELSQEISAEKIPVSPTGSLASSLSEKELTDIRNDTKGLSQEEVNAKLESILLDRIKAGDDLALFQLGQIFFEQENYSDARKYFERAVEKGDYQAMFQLGVMLFDGLGGEADMKRGFVLMENVANATVKKAKHLKFASQFNLGRAYFQGYGTRSSDNEAEKYWLLAADDGNPRASVKAQSTLGMFYSREENKDLKKAFFWHSEACGNGSLESQGALGVMYANGLGCKKDAGSAFVCLREAAERGNVYAMGNLVSYYYQRKLHTKTVELAARVALLENVNQIAQETECLPSFIAKGISMGCFYYGRCLHLGLGIMKDEAAAKEHYSKSYKYDPDLCAQLQNLTQHGGI